MTGAVRETIPAMESYGQYCPIARGSEIFATRWTPLIIRNMLLGARTFTAIREGVPGISKTLLTERLRVLEHYGIVERVPAGERRSAYELTDAGQALGPVCDALGRWGEEWLELEPEHLDAHYMLESLSKLLEPEDLPEGQVTIRFELGGRPRQRFWLLCANDRAEVCAKPPLPEDELVLETKPEWLARWHLGELSIAQGLHSGVFKATGPQRLVRMLGKWGGRGSMEYVDYADAPAILT
jgi:DNA-binding HxlR family transcriptional regulator